MSRKKSNKSRIFLSLVALLVIFFVASGITYSWIEGGTTLKMSTASKSISTKSDIQSVRTGTVKLSPDYTSSLSLTGFDSVTDSENLYFSPVSSFDGENFFFPAGNDDNGNIVSYRAATTNDAGNKFVKYDFKFSIDKRCFVYLSSEPEVTVWKNDVKQTGIDTSALRLAFNDGTTTRILTTADTAQTNSVVTDANGTVSSITAQPVSSFINVTEADKALFSYDKDKTGTMTVSIWLDCNGSEDSLTALSGCKVDISFGLTLGEEKYTVYFDAVTVDNQGNSSVGFDGGKIIYNDKDYTSKITTQCVAGESISATASAYAEADGWYDFIGWYTDADCINLVSESVELNHTPTADTTYYAKFVERDKHTISLSTVTTPAGAAGGTVTVGGSSTYTGYVGTTAQLSADVNENYRFVGWFTDAACTEAYSSSNVTIGDSDQTYYAKFIKRVTVTIAIEGSGTVTIDGEEDSSKTIDYNTSVTLNATPASGYQFDGFFNGEQKLTSLTVKITDDITYTAKFSKIPLLESKDYYIRGGLPGCNWDPGLVMYWVDSDESSGKVYRTFDLVANNTYDFKMYISGSWYTGNVSFTDTLTDIDFSTNEGDNTKITASKSQEYTFVYDVNTKKLSVYPSSGSYYVTSSVNANSGKTILLWDAYRVGNANYQYIKMYRDDGVVNTGYQSFVNTNYGKDFKNIYYYVLSDTNNNKLSSTQQITVAFGQDANGSNTKYVYGGMYKGNQKVITGYGSGNDMNDETYNPLTIKSISYPENGTAGTSYTLSLTPENGCPKYISDKGYSGSSTSYKNYSFSYSVDGGSYTTATTGSSSGTALSLSWTPTEAGTYEITFRVTDGIDTVTYTQTITIN